MSAISSQLSFPSPPALNINATVLNIMDSIYAIAFGLGLRALVDAVSQNFKLTASLIGLWEGVIMLHFLKKMPKSSDPYIAFGVRLFVDFLVTESFERLVLVLIWTAFGMVLADVAPAIWDQVGFKRVWRHFRRDLYTIYDRIPTVAFFPPPRTVRFLPPREPSTIIPSPSPSITTSQDTPIAIIPPSSSVPSEPLKRRVPGYYPGDFSSDTETDLGSIIRNGPFSRTEVDNALVSDLDDGNQSSGVSSSDSTEIGDPPSFNPDDIPDMEEPEEEQLLVDVKEESAAVPDPTTPKQKPNFIPMPPTPSDSAARWDIHRDREIENLPDLMEDGGATSDGWEKVSRRELDEEDKPPTPPSKDEFIGGHNNVSNSTPIPIIPFTFPTASVPPNTGSTSANPFDIDLSVLDSSSSVPQVTRIATENRRESVPPPYAPVDEYEEMYYNDDKPPDAAAGDDTTNVNEHNKDDNNDDNDFSKNFSRQTEDLININSGADTNPWSDAAAQAQADVAREEAAKKQAEEKTRLQTEESERVRKEEEERILKEAEDARKRKEAEEEAAKRKEAEEERMRKEAEEKLKEQKAEKARKEEADKKKKADEKAERAKKEAEDDALRKQKQMEAAAEEKKKKEEEAEQKRKEEEAEQKRKDEEEAEQKRKDEEVRKRKDEEEQKRKDEEEQKRKDEEKMKDEEEQQRKDAAEQKRKEDEKKKENEKQKETEDQEVRDTAEKPSQQEAVKQEQAEKTENTRQEQEEADRTAQTEAQETLESEVHLPKLNKRKAEEQATQEKDDDSKTLREADQNLESQQHQPGPSVTGDAQDTSSSPPHGDLMEEESVASAATTNPPAQAKERLERMMTLRAQMVELENRLDELEEEGFDEQSPEMKALEKVLRKYRRQAERRYAAGVQLAQYVISEEDKKNMVLEELEAEEVTTVLEELLEQLLVPTSRSIIFILTIAKAKQEAKKQRPIVMQFLEMYNLTSYTTENVLNNKIRSIKIPEEQFAGWLTGYRASVVKRDSEIEGKR